MSTPHCTHENQCLYTHDFFCEDCGSFFPKDSATYRRHVHLTDLRLECHNVSARSWQASKVIVPEALALADKISAAGAPDNYEELIAEAESFLAKYRE